MPIARWHVLVWFLFPGLALAQQPADSLLELGRTFLRAGAFERAEKQFDKYISTHKEEGIGYYELAKSLHLQGKKGPAKRAIRRALNHQPEEIVFLELQHEIGFETLRPLELAKKRAIISRILELDPGNAYANFDRGNEYAAVFLHHRNRVNVPELRPYESTLTGRGGPGDFADSRERAVEHALPPAREPFNIRKLSAQGYLVRPIDQQAREAFPLARRYLQQALRTDSTSRAAYESLLRILAANRDHEAMLQWAARMHRTVPGQYQSLFYVGYALHRIGRYDQAAQYFEKGLAVATPEEQQAYLDIRPIMADQAPLPENTEAYWQSKDPRMLSYYNERQLEHFARVVYTNLLFSEPKEDLAGQDSDRGMIHLRYGMPMQEFYMSNMIARCSGREVSGNVNSITNFHVFDYGDFQLAFGLPGNYGDSGTPAHNRIPPLNNYTLYTPCGDVLAHIDGIKAQYDSVIETENKIREEPERYQFAPASTHVAFPYLVSYFAGQGALTRAIVAYGIPLSGDQLTDPLPLSIQTGAFVVSDRAGRLAENRYAVGNVPLVQVREMDAIPLWNGLHELDVPPGDHALSVEFETTGGTVVGFQKSPTAVPDFNTTALHLSDILLATGIEEGPAENASRHTVVRKGYAIQPAPGNIFEREQPLYTYLEFYNLALENETARYRIEAMLQLQKADQGLRNRIRKLLGRQANQTVAIQFEEEAREANPGRYFILDLNDKMPGQYMLTFTLTDLVSESTVATSREVIVR